MAYTEQDIKGHFLCLLQQIDIDLNGKQKELAHAVLDITCCIVLDLNRIAWALEHIATKDQ